VAHVHRPGCCGKLDTGMGNWRKERDSQSMRRFASSPKLSGTVSGTLPRAKKTRTASKKPPVTATMSAGPLTSTSSMVNLASPAGSPAKRNGVTGEYGGTLPRQRRTESPKKPKRALPKTPSRNASPTKASPTAAPDKQSMEGSVETETSATDVKNNEDAAPFKGMMTNKAEPSLDEMAVKEPSHDIVETEDGVVETNKEAEEATAARGPSMEHDSLDVEESAPLQLEEEANQEEEQAAPSDPEILKPPRELTLEEVFPPRGDAALNRERQLQQAGSSLEEVIPSTHRHSLVRHSPIRHLPIHHSPVRHSSPQSRDSPPRSDRASRESSIVKEDSSAPGVPLNVVKGTDIDYVLANTELAGETGQHLRGATRATSRERKESESTASVKSDTPSDYKMGKIPTYLQERRERWRAEAEAAEKKRKESEGCPDGHVLLSESQRLQGLHKLKSEYKNILAEMARFPVRSDTLRARQKRSVLEKDLERIEEGIRTYEKQKVFVLKGGDGGIEAPYEQAATDGNNNEDQAEDDAIPNRKPSVVSLAESTSRKVSSGSSVGGGDVERKESRDSGVCGSRKTSADTSNAFLEKKASRFSMAAADRKASVLSDRKASGGSVVFAPEIEFA